MNHPLVEIRIEQELYGDPNTLGSVTIHWYHVPRVGDLIALPNTMTGENIAGKVKSVTWLAESVIVRLNGKVAS